MIPWSPVDRVIGSGIALCGLAIAALNSGHFVDQSSRFAPWWVVLCAIVPALQLITVVWRSRLSPAALRAIWVVQPSALLITLLLAYGAWTGDSPEAPRILVWLLDSAALASLALAVRLPYVLAAMLLLAAAPPLSSCLFLGELDASMLSWGFAHGTNIVFVMLTLLVRHELLRSNLVRAATDGLRVAEERSRAEAREFPAFARTVHDEVLSSFAAALHFSGETPAVLRDSAAAALRSLEARADPPAERDPDAELTSEQAAQLILDLVAAAAPEVSMQSAVLPGAVGASAAGAIGLAAAEAARNALAHAGGGAGTLAVSDGSIHVAVVDTGPGFDSGSAPADHFGVRESILARVRALPGGEVSIDSGTSGTSVVMRWIRPRA